MHTNNTNIKNGFSLIEVLVSVGIVSMILLLLSSFIFQLNYSNSKTKADREALENARRILDIIVYEIKGAKSIYAPTTTFPSTGSADQLSLETFRYLPDGEDTSFIDFFLCGTGLCLKKESQNPVLLNSDNVSVTNLVFTRILSGTAPSVKTAFTVSYKNPSGQPSNDASVSLNATVSLRSY